jgi:HEPN domain-containing protein
MDEQSVQDAEDRLSKARRKRRAAREALGNYDDNQSYVSDPSDVVTTCQRSIEHSAKAVFILVGVEYPTAHEIPLDGEEARQLMNVVFSTFPDYIAEQDTARLLLFTTIWGSVYPASEYGVHVDCGVVEAEDIFSRDDAEKALDHANEALNLAVRHTSAAQDILE